MPLPICCLFYLPFLVEFGIECPDKYFFDKNKWEDEDDIAELGRVLDEVRGTARENTQRIENVFYRISDLNRRARSVENDQAGPRNEVQQGRLVQRNGQLEGDEIHHERKKLGRDIVIIIVITIVVAAIHFENIFSAVIALIITLLIVATDRDISTQERARGSNRIE